MNAAEEARAARPAHDTTPSGDSVIRPPVRFILGFALVLVTTVSACGDSPVRFDLVDLEGDWIGTTGGLTLSLTLVETSAGLSGSGVLSGPDDSVELTVEGGRSEENITLTLSSSEAEPIQFTGAIVDADIIEGTLDGSGFFGDSITLLRD